MEDDLNFFDNGRRPHFFQNGRQPHFFQNGRQPQFFQMEDNIKQLNVT